jgi:hypothetical protein
MRIVISVSYTQRDRTGKELESKKTGAKKSAAPARRGD